MTAMRAQSTPARPDSPPPLGAHHDPDRGGSQVALWSAAAHAVTLCLLDEGGRESDRIALSRTDHSWHAFVPGMNPGQRYGFRVDGRWDPARGHRFNPAKLLLDPYARAITGGWTAHADTVGHRFEDPRRPDPRDSAAHVPHAVVVARSPGPAPRGPARPWAETVLYELHVRGFTATHPGVPEPLRGSYAGLAHPAVVDYLLDLGVTAVELLPVHQFLSEPALLARGLRNYWGYNTVGFFAPHGAYSSAGDTGGQVAEFRAMVAALHEAGLEVILDVVFNHTAEGDESGPTLSFRGIDNAAHYRHHSDGSLADVTGCGNTLDARRPPVITLIADCLRYWVGEFGVDGFRFDLATALLRTDTEVNPAGPLSTVIAQDPALAGVKLIAEPWDLGAGGYLLGGFPPPWAEWNDRFRDGVRTFWHRGDRGVAEVASRLTGSSDLFDHPGRRPSASINFVTAHDGFTLADLVSHSHKHNEANGEDNRDGTDVNHSANHGVEGETDDPTVRELRNRQMRNLLATLLLSAGTPMITAGDERARTQRGNNNAYCLDDASTWVDWTDGAQANALTGFTRALLRLRAAHPALRTGHFLTGDPVAAGGLPDVAWYSPAGSALSEAEWSDPGLRTLGMMRAADGGAVLLVAHAGTEPGTFALPVLDRPVYYRQLLSTVGEPDGLSEAEPAPAGTLLTPAAKSTTLFEVVPCPAEGSAL